MEANAIVEQKKKLLEIEKSLNECKKSWMKRSSLVTGKVRKVAIRIPLVFGRRMAANTVFLFGLVF